MVNKLKKAFYDNAKEREDRFRSEQRRIEIRKKIYSPTSEITKSDINGLGRKFSQEDFDSLGKNPMRKESNGSGGTRSSSSKTPRPPATKGRSNSRPVYSVFGRL